VLGEADRVAAGERALAAGDAVAFGRLMDASHASCRDDYEVSVPALDDLVAAAKAAGALGARLTGAGFGGATVSLVPAARVEEFLAALDAHFFRPRLPAGAPSARHRFALRARGGADVAVLETR
jgi:galactokinase